MSRPPSRLPACYRHPGPRDLDPVHALRPADLPGVHDRRLRSASSARSACAAGQAAIREPRTVFGGRITARQHGHDLPDRGLRRSSSRVQFLVGVNAVAADWGMWPVGGRDRRRVVPAAHVGVPARQPAAPRRSTCTCCSSSGPPLERLLGHARFLILYLLAGLGGAVASFAFSDINTVSVGASGAIFGLMGALVVAGRRLAHDVTQVLVLLGINVVIGFIAPGVDWRAHLGGLVTGAVAVASRLLQGTAGKQQTLVQVVGCAGIVLVLAAAVALWRADQISQLVPIR